MKNAIIAVLALLCGFLGWKLYAPNQQDMAEKQLDTKNNKDLFTCTDYSFSNSPFLNVLDSTGKINNEYVIKNNNELKYSHRINRRTTDRKYEETKLIMETDMLKYIYDYALSQKQDTVVFYYFSTERYPERTNYYFDRHASIANHKNDKVWRESIDEIIYLVTNLPESRADFTKATTSKIEVGKLCPPPGGSCK